MNDLESLFNLLRAVCLSFLAPFNFFYNLIITKNFSTPTFFLIILLFGYSFGVVSAVISDNKTYLGLFLMAIFFILASFVGKIYTKKKKKH